MELILTVSVVLCFLFTTVYLHVCMCTEMFQSATFGCCGWCSFLYYAWKIENSHWVERDSATFQDRQLKTQTGINVQLVFVLKENKGSCLKCGCPLPVSCFNYLIIRSFYDELNTEMNFTISLWWGDVLLCFIGTSVCCNGFVLLFLCKYLNKEKCCHLQSVYFFRWVITHHTDNIQCHIQSV